MSDDFKHWRDLLNLSATKIYDSYDILNLLKEIPRLGVFLDNSRISDTKDPMELKEIQHVLPFLEILADLSHMGRMHKQHFILINDETAEQAIKNHNKGYFSIEEAERDLNNHRHKYPPETVFWIIDEHGFRKKCLNKKT